MSWTRLIKTAAVLTVASCAGMAMAGSIVIRASGPSAKLYPAGKSVPDGQRLVLKAGDTVVLLDSRGTRTLTGAGNFDVGASEARGAGPSTFASLIGSAGGRQVRTGAVRGTGATGARVTNLWYIDTAKSGTVCLRDTSRATFWRASAVAPATMTLTRVSDGKSVPLGFVTGQAVKSWPVSDLPVTAGTDYRLSVDAAKHVTFRIVQAGGTTDDVDAVAADLIGKGCTAQVDVLVDAGRANAGAG